MNWTFKNNCYLLNVSRYRTLMEKIEITQMLISREGLINCCWSDLYEGQLHSYYKDWSKSGGNEMKRPPRFIIKCRKKERHRTCIWYERSVWFFFF